MIQFPNCKINLGLSILAKRADGYHELETIFYPIAISDALEILPSDNLSLTQTGIAVPGDPTQNLCLKAYHLLKKDFPEMSPVRIHLHKVVPIGAGLGGGSADCAFTIKSLNSVFDLGLDDKAMQAYASQLGSDCAFFIENNPKYCFGKGDQFAEITVSLKGKYIVLVNPNIHISTAEAYGSIKPKPANVDLQIALSQPVATWKDAILNDFETSLAPKYPVIQEIKDTLYELGAVYASMTGSGSTVFGIFENTPEIKQAFKDYMVWQGPLE